jgi:hypothetical protein
VRGTVILNQTNVWGLIDDSQTTTWTRIPQNFLVIDEGPTFGGATFGGVAISSIVRTVNVIPTTEWTLVNDGNTVTWVEIQT